MKSLPFVDVNINELQDDKEYCALLLETMIQYFYGVESLNKAKFTQMLRYSKDSIVKHDELCSHIK